ncbi:hypothetical protein F5051DRAFT_53011 [Lentinula edodes]|nr:hypothetical protein F5051DRAFT_53011 [Lentinula edodes]
MHSLYDDLHETHAHHAYHHTHTGRGHRAFLKTALIGFCLVPATLPGTYQQHQSTVCRLFSAVGSLLIYYAVYNNVFFSSFAE